MIQIPWPSAAARPGCAAAADAKNATRLRFCAENSDGCNHTTAVVAGAAHAKRRTGAESLWVWLCRSKPGASESATAVAGLAAHINAMVFKYFYEMASSA